MRRIILFCLVFLVATVGVAWAGTAAYKLVMSKDKELCTSMLKLFNEDMKKYGEIRYEEHPEFVRWESINGTQDRPYAKDCWQVLKSVFDINNDGTNDLVLRDRHCLQDVLNDSLYIFPADSQAAELITNPDAQVLASTKNKINFTGDVYYLRKGPKTKTGQLAAAIGGVLELQPFRKGQAFYISMTDLPQEWIVIAKYLHEEELEDICYFHGKSR